MNNKEPKNKSKIIGLVIGIIIFALAYFGAQQFFKDDFDDEMIKAAIELNKKLPVQVDKFSRLDSAATKSKSSFTYYYTLLNIEKSEVYPDSVYKYMKPGIIENIKTNPDLKMYRDNDITMEYRYYDKNGDFAVNISVPPNLYKKKDTIHN
jgi:hypothetical protein